MGGWCGIHLCGCVQSHSTGYEVAKRSQIRATDGPQGLHWPLPLPRQPRHGSCRRRQVRAAASTAAAHAKATQTTVTQLLHARDALCRGAHADWSKFDYMPEAAVQAGVRVGFSLLEADAAALSRVPAIHAALDSAYLAENPLDIKFATLIELLCVNNFPKKCGRLIRRKKQAKLRRAARRPRCRMPGSRFAGVASTPSEARSNARLS